MKKKSFIIATVAAIAQLPFMLLSVFNQPAGDDFWYTWMAKQYGFFEAQRQWFTTINGRYSANMFMSVNTWVYGSVISFKVLPALIIVSWVLIIYSLAGVVFDAAITKFQRWSLALILVAMYYINMPGLHEGCYWMSGVTGYQLPLLLFLLYPILTKNYNRLTAWKKYLFLPLYIFVAGGFHEMIALMAAVTGLYIIILNWLFSKKITGRYIPFTIASALAFLVQAGSIGNRHKVTLTEARKRLDIPEILIKAVSQTGYHIAKNCLLSPSFWIAAIIIFYVAYYCGNKIRFTTPSFKKAILSSGLLLPSLVLLPGLLIVYIENNLAPLRVMNISYFFFTSGAYTMVAFCGAYFYRRQVFSTFYSITLQKRIGIATLLAVAAMACTANERKVLIALGSGNAYHYNAETAARFRMIENCPQDICSFNCQQHQPLILCPVDICQDATLSRHLEKVFRKKLVKQVSPGP